MAKGGGGNNDKAIALQRQSMRDSRVQAKNMAKLMKRQAKAAENQVLPTFEGAAAAPTMTTADIEAVGNDARVRAMRRQGLNSTVYAGLKGMGSSLQSLSMLPK